MARVRKEAYSANEAGERVRNEIYKKDITITELAKKTGMSRSTVHYFVYDGIDISSVRLAKICGVLGISMDYVMGLTRG